MTDKKGDIFLMVGVFELVASFALMILATAPLIKLYLENKSAA